MKEKLDPYMQPLYDALKDMLPNEKIEDYILKELSKLPT
jgi:phosphate starvation-inducible PhoH-like protein